ncbi:MAG: alanine racemase [Actinomycetia bacterium]|nr:alanine racemase [Actinomycetes bacterium]
MRPSWIEVDLAAIEHNVGEIADRIAPAEFCAVVKADAYGHGDVPVAEAAIAGGASWLAVALIEEGVRLREAAIDVPILVLSEPTIDDVHLVVEHGLIPTAYRIEFVDQLAAVAERAGAPTYPVHLKLDTGMHRVGAAPVDAFTVARRIHGDDRLALQGVFTHFSVADDDPDYTRRQNTALVRFIDALRSEGIEPKMVHAANTAAALELPESRHDMCRIGLGMYGLRPTPNCGQNMDLRPAMRVLSHVGYVRRVPAQARPSYGRIREIESSGAVATIPIGYADGVARSLSGAGTVLINAERYRFAGQITMDMVIVDVGQDDVSVGDEVVFIGRQGDDEIAVEEWADLLGTVNYEVVCDFASRLPRRYTRGEAE